VIATIFLTSSVIQNEAAGEQASGKPAWEVLSPKVCGDNLCSEAEQEYSESKIPAWIKNNAGWWADGLISEDDFVKGIQFLIKEEIMMIPETKTVSQTSEGIPEWVKNNAGWWSEGLIGDADFVSGIQYLIQNGIISIEEQVKVEEETEARVETNNPPGFGREGFEIISAAERASLPDCGDVVYNQPIVDLNKISEITPLGNVDPPGHTLPTEHFYLHLKGEGTITNTITLVAPADIWITHISLGSGFSDDPEDNAIHFAACNDVSGYFGHIKKLSTQVLSILDEYECPGNSQIGDDECYILVFEPIKAGTPLGEVGRLQSNFDFGTYDYRTLHDFANPERYGGRSPHIECASDYYNDEIKNQFLELMQRDDGQCGKILYDIPGTLQGNWFFEGASATIFSGGDLFFGYDNVLDPKSFGPDITDFMAIISVGGVFTDPLRWKFVPEDSDGFNTKFENVKPDGKIYCYDKRVDDPNNYINKGPTGKILVQLINDNELKIELQNGDCPSYGETEFQNPTTYHR